MLIPKLGYMSDSMGKDPCLTAEAQVFTKESLIWLEKEKPDTVEDLIRCGLLKVKMWKPDPRK